MNIIQKVTLRHLKENKRRSLVTIIGVIISVAMITAVATLGISFLDMMIRQHIASEGEWHVQYVDVDEEQIAAIAADDRTEKLILTSDGYAAFEESENEYKPYLYVRNYNEIGMEQFPLEVKEGRLPENKDEIALSEEVIKQANVNYTIGDELTIDLGERVSGFGEMALTQTHALERDDDGIAEHLQVTATKAATIVGIIERPTWEPAWSPGYTVIGYIDEMNVSAAETAHARTVVSDINGSIYEQAQTLAEKHGIETVQFNSELLRYYGVTANDNLRLTLFSLAGIIMAIIIVGSVALIYNAFAISVSERARHLGMLASVGATKKQKRNSVFFEGAVIGLVSIPLGILAGVGGIGVTFLFINRFLADALGVSVKLELVVTPASILIACAVSILTIFISTYIPAQKASRISAIDAIRQTQDIKLSGKTVKTSRLVRKIFGLEGEIGLKNMKRNKKRHLATVFSLVISIVLFLSVSYFTDSLKKSTAVSQDDLKYDIQLYGDQLEKAELAQFVSLPDVTNSVIIDEIYVDALIEEEQLPALLQERIAAGEIALDDDGKYPYYVSIHGLDEVSFQAYAEEVGADVADFYEEDVVRAIVVEEISYQDGRGGKFIETKAIETTVGDTVDLYEWPEVDEGEPEPEKMDYLAAVEVGALTSELPIGVHAASLEGLNLIVPAPAMTDLPIAEEEINSYLFLNTSDPMATQAAIEELNDPSIYVFNVQQVRQQAEQLILMMSVFTYGFIVLISLISIANIFNTISTSISLRTREFAMLRSVGMTPKGFNKMLYYESVFYGVNALGFGLPISVLVMYGIHRASNITFDYGFQLPWMSIMFVTVMIFLIVGSAMLYSSAKMKKENIIEGLRRESV